MFFVILVGCMIKAEDTIKHKIEESRIVPDVIDQSPSLILNVKYSEGQVVTGNELKPNQVKDKPLVTWEGDASSYYTLVVVDPDAPSRNDNHLSEVKHWLAGNIPGSNIDQGDVIVDYLGALPPKHTGLHRYVFLLYKQDGKNNYGEEIVKLPNGRPNRLKFSVRDFTRKYNLGNPIRGTFFEAKWDPYVDLKSKDD